MEAVTAWILSFMMLNAPPGRTTFYAEAQESREDAVARYESIANDVIEVVYDPKTKPLYKGAYGRSRTVGVILSLMLYESGFMKNVDSGVGKFARGDNGRSWCLLQLNVGKGKTMSWNTREDRAPRMGDDPADIQPGFTGEEMVQDRKKCVIAGLRVLRISFSSCRGLAADQALRVYGSGSCEKGSKESAVRMRTAFKYWDMSRDKRTWKNDTEISEALMARRAAKPGPGLARAK